MDAACAPTALSFLAHRRSPPPAALPQRRSLESLPSGPFATELSARRRRRRTISVTSRSNLTNLTDLTSLTSQTSPRQPSTTPTNESYGGRRLSPAVDVFMSGRGSLWREENGKLSTIRLSSDRHKGPAPRKATPHDRSLSLGSLGRGGRETSGSAADLATTGDRASNPEARHLSPGRSTAGRARATASLAAPVGPLQETRGGQGSAPSRFEAEEEERKKISGLSSGEEEEYLPLWLRMSGGEEEGVSESSNLRQRKLDLTHPVLNGSSHIGVVNKQGTASGVARRASDSNAAQVNAAHQLEGISLEDFHAHFGAQRSRSRGTLETAQPSNSSLRERVLAASERIYSGAQESGQGGRSQGYFNNSRAGLWSRADTPKQQATQEGGNASLGQPFHSPNARHIESPPWKADTAPAGGEGSQPRKLQATNSERSGTNGPTTGSSSEATQSLPSSPSTTNLRTPSITPLPAPPTKQRPIIFPISSTALRSLIPLSGSGNQVLRHLGGPLDWLRRLVLSLSGAVFLYNVSPLATIVAAFYWAWAPIWSAAISNVELRRKYPYGGLWIGRVLKTITEKLPNGQRQWRLVIGDRAGVRVEVCTEIPSLPMQLARGEPVQMVALSDTEDFSRFRILREAFLPRRGVWLAEEAAVERPVFECLQVHLVPSVLNKLPAEDDEDWESMFSLMCDETSETLRQYSYEDDPRGYNAETMPFNLYEGPPGGSMAPEMQMGDDIAIHALLSDGQEAEIRDQFRD